MTKDQDTSVHDSKKKYLCPTLVKKIDGSLRHMP
jgi:hypothetical protein